jgi:chromate reductase
MKIKILTISGSLRKDSSNHKVINKLSSLIPQEVEFIIYNDLDKLPHFDGEENYPIINEWRQQLRDADGVLICTPEYAFGVPGSLKNALDWTVSSGDLYEKPVALITASSSGDKGHASLLQTLTALSAKMNDQTKLLVPLIRSKFDTNGDLTDATTLASLKNVVVELVSIIKQERKKENA